MIVVNSEKCPQDHVCPMIKRCEQEAISQEGFKAPMVDHEKCIECMICVKNCPKEAFEVVKEEKQVA